MSFYKEVPGRQTTLESALKFDTEPKAGSTNPVTSDGVKSAIDGAVGDASAALQQQIDEIAEKAGSGYIPKGEATVATLNALSVQENGELYTMTDAGTLTLGSLAVVAGDTVAWDATNEVWYKAMDYAPRQYGTNEVHNLPTTITSFRTGDVIPVDGPDGTAKMAKDDLLRVTAENALVNDVTSIITSRNLVYDGYIVDFLNLIVESVVGDGGKFDASLSLNGYWSAGTLIPSTNSKSTTLIPIRFFKSILYTGAMGQTVANWFDGDGSFISQSVRSDGTTLIDKDVLHYAPANAKYVALSSRNLGSPTPPSETPEVKAYVVEGIYNTLMKKVEVVKDVPLSLAGYYGAGVLVPSENSNSTPLIDITNVSRILYTGAMGQNAACWFDDDENYISDSVLSSGNDLNDVDVMLYAPSNARYVGLSSRNSHSPTPPGVTPKVTKIISPALGGIAERIEYLDGGVVAGNGVDDATNELQKLFDNSDGCVNLTSGTLLISDSIVIDVNKIKIVRGNSTTIKINTDKPCFKVKGSLVSGMTANPTSLTKKIINGESATIIDGVRFTSTSASAGTAIEISGCIGVKICNNYIYMMKNGIVITGVNRNLIFEGNNIYGMLNTGLLFESANLHQCNIYGNHISYCRRCIDFENCEQLANFQIVGNDIELSSYPSDSQDGFRCIRIAGCTGLCSEFEIVGNTLQAHYNANRIIDIQGISGNSVYNVSITGNQISNAAQNLVYLAWVHNVSCSGNTLAGQLADSAGSTYYLANNCDNVSISGDCVRDGSCFVETAETSRINRLSVANNVSVENAGSEFFVKINNAYAHGVQCSGNVLERGKVQIKSQDLNFVSVCNNTCLSNFEQDIGVCQKLKVENNL